jgi:biopolymer transport protein ExbD
MPTRFIKPQWRPSTALRRSRLHIAIDVSAFLSIMFFLVFLHLRLTSVPHPGPPPADLPPSSHSTLEPAALREDAMRVFVTRDGSLYFRGTRATRDDLPIMISASLRAGSERTVYISADARAKYADVKSVIDRVRESGITNITLMTHPAAIPGLNGTNPTSSQR